MKPDPKEAARKAFDVALADYEEAKAVEASARTRHTESINALNRASATYTNARTAYLKTLPEAQ